MHSINLEIIVYSNVASYEAANGRINLRLVLSRIYALTNHFHPQLPILIETKTEHYIAFNNSLLVVPNDPEQGGRLYYPIVLIVITLYLLL